MPTLRRIHFSCCGNPEYARFEDLHLSLVDEQGNPDHHLFTLLNGGGKTTLLSLVLSCLRPHRNEFLAFLAKPDSRPRRGAEQSEEPSKQKKPTNLESYVLEKDLAVITTEWSLEMPGALTLSPLLGNTMVIGQIIQWKNRKITSDPASDLRRGFFYFRTVPGQLDFDHVPVKGLNRSGINFEGKANAFLFEQVKAWYRDVARTHPSAQTRGLLIEGPSEWASQLKELGIDSQLFAMQIKLNASGITKSDELRINTPHDFTKILFRLGIDQTLAKEALESLRGYRSEFKQRESLRADITYLERITPESAHFSELYAQFSEATKSLAANRQSVTEIAVALNTRKRIFIDRISSVADDLTSAEKDRAARTQELALLEAQHAWYRRRHLELSRDELDAVATAEKKSEAAAVIDMAVAQAAIHQRRHEAASTRRHQLEAALDQQLQPLLDKRRRAAADLVASCASALLLESAVEVGEIQKRTDVEKRMEGCQQKSDALLAKRTKAENQITMLRGQAENRASALKSLLDQGAVQLGETADHARDRIHGLVTVQTDAIRLLCEEEETLRLADEALRRTRNQHAEAIQPLLTNREQRQAFVTAGQTARDSLLRSTIIQSACESAVPNLSAPTLITSLQLKIAMTHGRIASSTALLRDDEATREYLGKERILPPPQAVLRVIEHLEGLHTYAAYTFLRENVTDANEAANWLRQNPWALSGVLVHDEQALHEALERCKAGVPGLAAPVHLSVKPDLSGTPTAVIGTAVLPAASEYGRFNATAASSARPGLDQRIEANRTAMTDSRNEVARESAVLGNLEGFLKTYGDQRLEVAMAELADLERQIAAVKDTLSLCDRQLATTHGQQKICSQQLKIAREINRSLEVRVRTVERFLDAHGNEARVLERANDIIRAEEDQIDADRQITELREATKRYGEERDAILGAIRESTRRASAVRAESAAVESDGSGLNGTSMPLPAARAIYQAAKDTYEQVSLQNDLNPQIERAQLDAANAATERNRTLGSLPHSLMDPLVHLDEMQLTERIDQSARQRDHAHAAHIAAQAKRGVIASQLTAHVAAHPSTLVPAGSVIPMNSGDAENLGDMVHTEVEQAKGHVQAAHQMVLDLAKETDSLTKNRDATVVLVDQVQREIGDPPYAADGAELPSDPALLAAAVNMATRSLRSCVTALKEMTTAVSKRLMSFMTVVLKGAGELRMLIDTKLVGTTIDDPTAFLAAVEDLHPLLTTHLRILIDRRDQENKRLDALIDAILQIGDHARHTILDTERESKLPSGMEAWSGQHFLRFTMRMSDPSVARARVQSFIDSWCVAKSDMTTEELIDRSFFALTADGFQVQVFKPESVLSANRHSVDSMGGWSDGERLTMVIVLYSIMSRMRSMMLAKHGQGTALGDVLFLDNPIGEASRGSLIAVQHRIARQLGLQLVCTTGIMDPEVISHFRCRTFLAKRRSVTSGRDYVVKDVDQSHEDVLGALLNIRKAPATVTI